jgi:methylamine dehydrogenase heavy chain
MRKSSGVACLACAAAFVGGAAAAQEFEPETISVEAEIAPGPNVFVGISSWDGAGAVVILSADDLSYKADVSTGLTSQFMISPDGSTIYTTSIYPKRIVSGPIEAVLAAYDVKTTALKSEVIIPDHLAQTMGSKYLIRMTADGRFLIAQNATPATSVTVVNLATGASTEIPTPGCWAFYPATSGAAFSSICGDGTLTTITLDDTGALASQTDSEPLFDMDMNPVFVHAEPVGENMVFMSFAGDVITVSMSGTPTVVDTFSIVEGVEGGWAPSGYEVLAYSAETGILFVPMHSGATNGSHKNGSEEIWAINLADKTVVARSPAEHVTNIAVTSGPDPVLFGVNSHEGGVYRFEVADDFSLTETAHLEITETALVLTEP